MLPDLGTIFVLALVVLVCVLCIFQTYALRSSASVDDVVRKALDESDFNPNQFKIYDRSTDAVCNRLIVVAPFDWYVWACRGEVYILSPERGTRCAEHSAPAVQVFADRFVETCLTLDLDSILHQYIDASVPVLVPYEIPDRTFTILSALNLLFKRWIPLATEGGTAGQREVRMRRLLRPPSAAAPNTAGRVVSEAEVIRLTAGETPNPTRIRRKVEQHAGKLASLAPETEQPSPTGPTNEPETAPPAAATEADDPAAAGSSGQNTIRRRRHVYEPSPDLFYSWEKDVSRITRRMTRDPDRRIYLVETRPVIRGPEWVRPPWSPPPPAHTAPPPPRPHVEPATLTELAHGELM